MKTFTFTQDDTESKKTRIELKKCFEKALGTGKVFEVVLRKPEYMKSPKQIRGFHRIVHLITEYINNNDTGEVVDDELIKEWIKKDASFQRTFRGQKFYKSCIDATQDEMNRLIVQAQVFGYSQGMEEESLELLSHEKRQMWQHYNVKNSI